MEYIFNTRLRGNIALTDSYHTNLALQKDNTLYKFIWVQSGSLQLEIDHVPTTLMKGEIIPYLVLEKLYRFITLSYLSLTLSGIECFSPAMPLHFGSKIGTSSLSTFFFR